MGLCHQDDLISYVLLAWWADGAAIVSQLLCWNVCLLMNINKLSPHLVSLAHSILNPLILSLPFSRHLISSNWPFAVSLSHVYTVHTHTHWPRFSVSVCGVRSSVPPRNTLYQYKHALEKCSSRCACCCCVFRGGNSADGCNPLWMSWYPWKPILKGLALRVETYYPARSWSVCSLLKSLISAQPHWDLV